MPTAATEILDRITIRGAEVLALVADGYTHREIAKQLGVETTTIKGKTWGSRTSRESLR